MPPISELAEALTASGSASASHVEAWMVIALVFAGGVVTAIDNPARQAFVSEIVGADRVVNAVSLNSILVHSSRIAGPAVAAGIIAIAGVGPCFLLNALSFAAMLIALRRMDPAELEPARRTPRAQRPAARGPALRRRHAAAAACRC